MELHAESQNGNKPAYVGRNDAKSMHLVYSCKQQEDELRAAWPKLCATACSSLVTQSQSAAKRLATKTRIINKLLSK